MNDNWLFLKKNLLSTLKHVCGVSSRVPWKKQTWWWNSGVDAAVTEKRKFFKLWKAGGSRDDYVSAKRASNRIIYLAKNEALKCHLQKNKADFTKIFRLPKHIRHNNQDVVCEKPVLNDTGTLSLDDSAKKAAWREYYVHLVNHEFPWDENNLSDILPIESPSPPIINDMVRKAVCKMILGKAAGPSGAVSKMIKGSGGAGIELTRDHINAIIAQNRIPSDWQYSYIVNLYKGKGDALIRGNYRGLKLMDHVMKTVERVVEALIRRNINIDEMQCGFMPERCTTDAIFILRQLQKKYMAANKPCFRGLC